VQVSDFTADKPGELVRNLGGDWCFVPGLLPGKLLWTDELVSALPDQTHCQFVRINFSALPGSQPAAIAEVEIDGTHWP
jgi:hypothetical protein